VAYFSRQIKGATERALENGRWLDSASQPVEGKLRSVDAMISLDKSRPRVTVVANRNAADNLVVELLWIETNDFMGKVSGKP
jgi:hypothetical protein